MPQSTKNIYQNFEQFVNNVIATYELQFYDYSLNEDDNNWFRSYWKPFFDELINESSRLYHLYKGEVEHPQEFARHLQQMAEQGLINFEKMTEAFSKLP